MGAVALISVAAPLSTVCMYVVHFNFDIQNFKNTKKGVISMTMSKKAKFPLNT